MPKRKTMPELRDIIIRLKKGQSIRGISRETGSHRKVIREIRDTAFSKGWLSEDAPLPSEEMIAEAVASRSSRGKKSHPLDAHREDIKRWVKDKYSCVVIHRMLSESFACSESTVRRYIKRVFPSSPVPVIPRMTIPGEVMEVDFGYLGISYDAGTRRNRKTWLFSGRLRHSRDAYREIVFSQHQDVFFACHIHAFEHFGGVPQKVVPDNLKAAVIRASFDNPLINRSYRMLAEHYGFLISPHLPYHPHHKGGVESDIKYVKGNFLPEFKETQRRLGREVWDADELKKSLRVWEDTVASCRVIRGVGRTPRELFINDERAALQPLPQFRWDPVEWKECTVGRDWHIQYRKAFYSAPYRLIGKRVLVCGSMHLVRIFHDSREVTTHPRAKQPWKRVTRADHGPKNYEKYLQTTKSGVLAAASRNGPATRKVVEEIFAQRGVDGLRPARGLLRLGKRYGPGRLEAACTRALEYHTATYQSVKSILIRGLDEDQEERQGTFRFAREAGYFDPSRYT